MVNAPKPLPRDLGALFTRSGAIARGVTDRQLRALYLARPFRGVRRRTEQIPVAGLPSRPEEWKARQRRAVDDYSVLMLPHQFYSGWTAAVLWKLPTPFALVKDVKHIEISTFAPRRPPRRPGIAGSQIRPYLARTVWHEGRQVLDPVSVWATLAPRLPLPDRVALGDAVIRTPRFPGGLRPPQGVRLGTLEELRCMANAKGRPGRQKLLEALPLLRDGAASAPESHLRLALADAGLPEAELDFDVFGEAGRFLGCSELAYPEFKLALEYEGDHHRTQATQWNRDIQKYQDYTQAGWEVIRITKSLLYTDRRRLMWQIRNALQRRGWQG